MLEAIEHVDVAQIRRQLRELADRNEITELVSRLGLWLDEQRFDEARSIFTEDVAVQTPGGESQGIALVAEQARRNHAGYARTQHVITNILVTLDGDRATVQANLIVTFVHRADAPEQHFALGERYQFEAVRTPQGWRLSRMHVSPVWSAGSRNAGSPAQTASPATSGN